jgi:hypothetical protein
VANDQGRSQPHFRTKEERANELLQLLETRAGRIQVWALFTNCRGGLDGRMPPSGPVLIQAILAHEFPAAEAVCSG